MASRFLRTVYINRYVQIESKGLGLLYFGGMALTALWSLIQVFLQHGYVVRPQTHLAVSFWRYTAVDGNWWLQPDGADREPAYCGSRHWWGNSSAWGFWGSDRVACRSPEAQKTTFFYFQDNLLKVATSIAYGNELNASELYFYRDIEKVGVVFQINFFNEYDTQEVSSCRAFDRSGAEVASRWANVSRLAGEPEAEQQQGLLMLTLEDILRAAGKSWDESGQEWGEGMDAALPLRLQGIELVAEVRLQNFHRPFAMVNTTECSVNFRVFRDQFTEVQRFYRGEELVAIQNGLKLRVVGSASLGYPSVSAGLQTFALGLCMASGIGTLVELVATLVHPRREEVNHAQSEPLVLSGEGEGGSARPKAD